MNAGKIIPSHWYKVHLVQFNISYFQRRLRGLWKFVKMITRARNQFLGGSIPWKHPVRPKMQVKCSQFAFLGIPRVFVQNLLWRFTDNPFWRSVLFIQQQGQNWQAVPCTGERPTYKEQKMERCTLYSSCTYSTRWDLNCPTPRSLFGRTAHYGTFSVSDTLPTGILMAL